MLKKDILATLIIVSSKFNKFKTNIMLEIDNDTIITEPLETKYGVIDIYDINYLIIDILQKYKEALESSYMRSVYVYIFNVFSY